MGTNFYYIRPIPQSKKTEMKSRIDEINNIEDLYEMITDVLEPHVDPTTEDNVYNIHIGKRSGGWQFLFSLAISDYCESLTKEGILDWLRTGIIVDEYGEKYTPEQFWKECVDDCSNGKISNENDQVINGLRFTDGKYFFC